MATNRITLITFPIADNLPITADKLKNIVEEIQKLENSNSGKIYIHCGLGQGRTGSVLCAHDIINGNFVKRLEEYVNSGADAEIANLSKIASSNNKVLEDGVTNKIIKNHEEAKKHAQKLLQKIKDSGDTLTAADFYGKPTPKEYIEYLALNMIYGVEYTSQADTLLQLYQQYKDKQRIIAKN